MPPRKRLLLSLVALSAVLVFWLLGSGYQRQTAPLALPTWPAPALPDTPAGRQLGAFLAAFNAGDEDTLRAFASNVEEHFSPVGPNGSDIASRVRSQLRLHKASRGLNVYEVAESDDDAITIVAQFRLTQEWRRMTFLFESEPPHRITGVMIVPTDPPDLGGAVPLTDEQVRQRIDDYVTGLAAADAFSGVVLVAKDGVPLFERAYGMADRERGVPNQPATRFGYASVGKMFTAVAVAQLVEAGKLDYDASVERYLPEYAGDAARRVTLGHLLTHQSGIADYFEEADRFGEVAGSPDPERAFLPLIMREPLRFAPGERFEYSNTNYLLLGALVEKASGLPYAAYLQRYVFDPAGMSETSLEAPEAGLLARGYTAFGEDGELGTGPRRPSAGNGDGGAAGGGYTTARDLLRFDRAFRTHVLLPPAAAARMLEGRVDYGRPGYRYGYGFILRLAGDEPVAGHSGGFPGVDAQFDAFLDSGYTIVVLANYELVAEPVVMHAQRLLLRS